MEDNKKLQARVKNLDTGYVAEYGTRLQAQAEQAKKLYTDAYAAGDAAKMAEAQQAMAAIAVEQQNYNTAKMRIDQQAKAQYNNHKLNNHKLNNHKLNQIQELNNGQ